MSDRLRRFARRCHGNGLIRDDTPLRRQNRVIRGHVLDAQLLREYAVLNFDLYGFYGLSAFQTSADWTQERIMAQKLARAARVTVFEHQTLLEHGLAVLPTGAAPHGDIVMASTSGHRDGQPGDLDELVATVRSCRHDVAANPYHREDTTS